MGSHDDIPTEPGKMVVVIVFLTLAAFSNWIALAYIHDFVGSAPLPDLVFSLIPEQKWAAQLGDTMVTLNCSMLILLFIFHSHRTVLIRRTFFILGVLYALRTASMLSTQLPSAYADNDFNCQTQLNASQRTFMVYLRRVLVQTAHVGFQDIESRMLCGDLLFSGHTLMVVVCSLTIAHYLPPALKCLQYVPKAAALLGVVCMVISRTHYTVDVLFAYLVSVGVFTMYHAFCEIDTNRDRKNSVLQHLWLFQVVSWLEENVAPGRLENRLEIPFFSLLRSYASDGSTTPNGGSQTTQTHTIVGEIIRSLTLTAFTEGSEACGLRVQSNSSSTSAIEPSV